MLNRPSYAKKPSSKARFQIDCSYPGILASSEAPNTTTQASLRTRNQVRFDSLTLSQSRSSFRLNQQPLSSTKTGSCTVTESHVNGVGSMVTKNFEFDSRKTSYATSNSTKNRPQWKAFAIHKLADTMPIILPETRHTQISSSALIQNLRRESRQADAMKAVVEENKRLVKHLI